LHCEHDQAVTKLVQGLENHLRVRLLNRTTRRVTVTPDGSAYYERAVRLLGDLEDIESSVSNAQANPKGRLRIDVGGSLASLFLIPRLPDFIERYPEIQVELGVSDRPVDLIGENIDCVIRGGPLTEQSLVARHVGDFPWVTCATPAYLARHGTPTHPSDFESQHVVVSRLSALTSRPFPLGVSLLGTCQRKCSMPARCKAFLQTLILAFANGFPAYVK
jgi:DNA-binding transcriptional LysR family regulator